MNEGTFSPPVYNDLYNFRDGAQDDIFQDSYDSIPTPSPNQTEIPQLRISPNNTGVPALPSSSTVIPLSSTTPYSEPSSTPPDAAYPTPSPLTSSPPVPFPPPATVTDTVTNTVFVTVIPNNLPTFTPNPPGSINTPIPSPSSGAVNPSIIILNKRKPM